jgi:hypothetical protein
MVDDDWLALPASTSFLVRPTLSSVFKLVWNCTSHHHRTLASLKEMALVRVCLQGGAAVFSKEVEEWRSGELVNHQIITELVNRTPGALSLHLT